MSTYTVLLRRPDYISDAGETYLAHVEADTVIMAVIAARADALLADGNADGDPTDYAAELVVAGHHVDLWSGQ